MQKKRYNYNLHFSTLVSCNDDNEKNNNEQKANTEKLRKQKLTFFLSKVNQEKSKKIDFLSNMKFAKKLFRASVIQLSTLNINIDHVRSSHEK